MDRTEKLAPVWDRNSKKKIHDFLISHTNLNVLTKNCSKLDLRTSKIGRYDHRGVNDVYNIETAAPFKQQYQNIQKGKNNVNI